MSTGFASYERPAESWGEWLARRAANLRERLQKGLISDSVQVGLKRSALTPEELPVTKLPLSVRRLTQEDVDELLPADVRGLSRDARADVLMRRQLADLVPECGIAVIDERSGNICFVQWLIGHQRNDALSIVEGLPRLAEGEMILEGAYVPPGNRGRTTSLAAAGVALAHACELGAREIITYVGEANTVSMRGVTRMGFRPYMLHVRRHLLFGLIQYDRFRPVSPDDPRFQRKS